MRKNLKHLSIGLGLAAIGPLVGCVDPASSPVPRPGPTSEANADPATTVPEVTSPAESNSQKSIVVHQDADRSVQLSALTASLAGDGLHLDENDRIVGFRNRTQRAVWSMKLVVPGTYQIESQTLCTGPTREARIRVHIGKDLYVEGLAELSDRPDLPATSLLGELKLDAPRVYQVEVEMVGLPLVGKFGLAELRLLPTETESSSLPKFMTEMTEEDSPE